MRLLMLVVVGFALTISGCCSGENAEPVSESASTAKECPTGGCCTSVSRAALMKKGTTAEQEAPKSE